MDQEIGIKFQPNAAGMTATIDAFTKVSAALDSLYEKANNMGSAFGKWNEATADAARGFRSNTKQMEQGLTDLGRTSEKVFGQMAKSMQMGGGPVGTGKTPGGVGDMFGGAMLPWFMIRWKLWTEGLRGLHYATTEIGMGKIREPMVEPLAGLAYLGADRPQLLEFEERARGFRRSYPAAGVKPPEWLDAAREHLSGFSQFFTKENMVKEVGDITDMTSALAKAAKTPITELAKVVGQINAAQVMRMPVAEQDEYRDQKKSMSVFATRTMSDLSDGSSGCFFGDNRPIMLR